MMRFGIALTAGAAEIPALARAAEEAGMHSGWVHEHLVWPVEIDAIYPYTEDGKPPVAGGFPTHDPWVLLGAAAAATTTLRLGTSVYVLPLRDPHVTARAVATVDSISGGRAILGIGVGWLEDEFAIVGQDFASRGRRTDEIIAVLRGLWSPGPFAYSGEHYSFPSVHFEPKPPQGAALPFLMGGESNPALRRAATLGDGWLGLDHTLESVAPQLEKLNGMRAKAERLEHPFYIAIRVAADCTVEDVARYAELGVNEVRLAPAPAVNGVYESPYVGLERTQRLLKRYNGTHS